MTLPASQPPRYTVKEYLRIERDSMQKHEYRDGQVVAMAGATPAHVAIATNVAGELRTRLRGTPCRPYSADLRVRISGTPLYTYPDVSVICGPLEFDEQDERRETVTNPRVIVEVLSPSTEAYDRGEKLRRYLRIPSFSEYVLVSQAAAVVETYARQPDGLWVFHIYEGMGVTARLRSLEIDLPLAEVYAGGDFPPPPPPLPPRPGLEDAVPPSGGQ